MVNSVYEDLLDSPQISSALNHIDEEFDNHVVLRSVEEKLRFPLRPYQKRASLILELLLQNPILLKDTYEIIKDNTSCPMLTFEMATGAGKTMQMLAHMLYLYQTYRYKDFLIITPNNTIYDKTIENFTVINYDSEWAPNVDLKVNVVTSDNYKEKKCWEHDDPDLTLYIFNVQKFYSKSSSKNNKGTATDLSKGTPWVFRPIEDSVWKDNIGNCISFIDYLKSREKLAVLSDEAHHYQQSTSKQVITDLFPDIVLEYTATPQKGLQNVVYEYGIKSLIDERYSKRIRTLSYGKYSGNIETKAELVDEDKKKIILGLIVHQIKKVSVTSGEKALCLLKARSIEHAKKIEDFMHYIKYEKALFLQVLNEIEYSQSTMAKLVFDQYEKDKEMFWSDVLKTCAALPLRFDSETNQNYEIRNELMRLELPGTLTEVIIAVDALDEGWNVKRLYTIVVLHEGEKEIATSVKQLIGRGIRLYREQRIKDSKPIKDQQDELLHIICVAGRSFDRAIAKISEELGLSGSDLGADNEFEEIDIEIKEPWKEQPIPQVEKETVSIYRRTRNAFKTDMEAYLYLINRFSNEYCTDKSLSVWLNKISIQTDDKNILGILPSDGLIEQELYTTEFIEDENKNLLKEMAHIKLTVPNQQLIDTEIFQHLSIIGQINEAKTIITPFIEKAFLNLFRVKGLPENIAHEKALRSLMHFIKDNLELFWNDVNIKHTAKKLNELFLKETVSVPKTRIIDNPKRWLEETKEIKAIKSFYFTEDFSGLIFGNGFFVDSGFELDMALKLSKWFEKESGGWLKNQNQYSIPYKNNQGKWYNYFPDFIIFYKNEIYLLETKGDIYLENAIPKKEAAEDLYNKGYPINYLFLLYSDREKMNEDSFEEFILKLKKT